MAKMIKLFNTEEEIMKIISEKREEFEKILSEFQNELSGSKKTMGNKIKKTVSLEFNPNKKIDKKAIVNISQKAFIKMISLVCTNQEEIAWNGTAFRSEEKENVFHIEDIFVYPQEVTGITVDRDRKKYYEWLISLDDNVFNNLRVQGHSHVNMGVSPSATDIEHQVEVLDQLDETMFYIFIIMNKDSEINFRIFDVKNNILYDNEDISYKVDGVDLEKFLIDAKKIVDHPKPKYTTKKYKDIWDDSDDEFFGKNRKYYGYIE